MTPTPQPDERDAALAAAAGELRLVGKALGPCPWPLNEQLPRERWAARCWQALAQVAARTLPGPLTDD